MRVYGRAYMPVYVPACGNWDDWRSVESDKDMYNVGQTSTKSIKMTDVLLNAIRTCTTFDKRPHKLHSPDKLQH